LSGLGAKFGITIVAGASIYLAAKAIQDRNEALPREDRETYSSTESTHSANTASPVSVRVKHSYAEYDKGRVEDMAGALLDKGYAYG
jgi:hypothetical protein